MALVKLKTKNDWKAGQTNILPFIGSVQFNQNAEIEVEEEIAKKLIAYSIEFFIPDSEEEDIKKKSEDNEELGKSGEPDIAPQVEEQDISGQIGENQSDSEIDESQKTESHQDIRDSIRQKLSELKVKEIKDQYLSQFPEELVKDLKNRDQYIDFLVEQLSK